jgi:hypothetical protein
VALLLLCDSDHSSQSRSALQGNRLEFRSRKNTGNERRMEGIHPGPAQIIQDILCWHLALASSFFLHPFN